MAFGMNAQRLTDDQKHWVAGSLISGVSGSAAYELGARPFHAACIGFGLGTLAGIAKEAIWDKRMKRGMCDNGDAFTTSWGALFGSLTVTIYVDKMYKRRMKNDLEDYVFIQPIKDNTFIDRKEKNTIFVEN